MNNINTFTMSFVYVKSGMQALIIQEYSFSNILPSLLQLLWADGLVSRYDPVFSRWTLQVQNEGVFRWACARRYNQLHDGKSDSPTWEACEWQVSEQPWAFPRGCSWGGAIGKISIQYGRGVNSEAPVVAQRVTAARDTLVLIALSALHWLPSRAYSWTGSSKSTAVPEPLWFIEQADFWSAETSLWRMWELWSTLLF